MPMAAQRQNFCPFRSLGSFEYPPRQLLEAHALELVRNHHLPFNVTKLLSASKSRALFSWLCINSSASGLESLSRLIGGPASSDSASSDTADRRVRTWSITRFLSER